MPSATRKNKQVDPLAAVATRIYIGEIPYIKMFLDHYRSIGFSRVYLIITNKSETKIIQDYLHAYSSFVTYIISPTRTIRMPILSELLAQAVSETYLLHVDVDEFLDIRPHKSIKALLKAEPGAKYHFYWNITVNDGLSNPKRAFDAHFSSKPYKTMCKTSLIKTWKDSHNCETLSPTPVVKSKFPLIHSYGRSFNDILIKCILGKNYVNKQKNTNLREILNATKTSSVNDIVNRLKMLAVVSRVPKPLHIHPPNYAAIDHDAENQLIDIIGQDKRDILYEKYVQFRTGLDLDTQVSQYYKRGLSGITWDTLEV